MQLQKLRKKQEQNGEKSSKFSDFCIKYRDYVEGIKLVSNARFSFPFCRFDFLLKRDQEFFVEPDYKTPFTSKEDAVERLMKYHLGRDRTEMDFDDFDEEFSETAVRLLDKFAAMVAKYKYLMLKESMVCGSLWSRNLDSTLRSI